jgi:predicted Rossmann fold nucleotide-binding protein DprA/Smf involved in DNA uptake
MSNPFYLGDIAILNQPKVAFLSSRKISSATVLKCFDWATEQRDKDACVISGYHSPLEKDVLHFLLKGLQPVILVLGRSIYKQLPNYLHKPLDTGRLLIVSPVSQSIQRQSVQSCTTRNKYIINNADEVVFGSLDEKGNLYPLYRQAIEDGKKVKVIS